MNNSDLLNFDYSLPVSELPHHHYNMYVDMGHGYDLYGTFKKEDAHKIPFLLDQLYCPTYKKFLIIGKHEDYDDILDMGYIIQETYRYKKEQEKRER